MKKIFDWFLKGRKRYKGKVESLRVVIAQLEEQNRRAVEQGEKFKHIADEALALAQKKTNEPARIVEKFIELKRFDTNDLEYGRELTRIYESEEFRWFMYQASEVAMQQFINTPDVIQKQRIAAWIEGFDLVMQNLLKNKNIFLAMKQKGSADE